MKPIFQKLTSSPDEGFAFKVVRGHSFDCPWHFHNEYELILIVASGGYPVNSGYNAAKREIARSASWNARGWGVRSRNKTKRIAQRRQLF